VLNLDRNILEKYSPNPREFLILLFLKNRFGKPNSDSSESINKEDCRYVAKSRDQYAAVTHRTTKGHWPILSHFIVITGIMVILGYTQGR